MEIQGILRPVALNFNGNSRNFTTSGLKFQWKFKVFYDQLLEISMEIHGILRPVA
jgi:hypothetical protein